MFRTAATKISISNDSSALILICGFSAFVTFSTAQPLSARVQPSAVKQGGTMRQIDASTSAKQTHNL